MNNFSAAKNEAAAAAANVPPQKHAAKNETKPPGKPKAAPAPKPPEPDPEEDLDQGDLFTQALMQLSETNKEVQFSFCLALVKL